MSLSASNKALSTLLVIIDLATIAFCAAAATPSAISVPVRTTWYGYDGNWSPVSIRVGTPPQWIDLFVSTAAQETWVVGPGGCDGTAKCEVERGGKLFQANESSTWEDQGAFALGLDPQLGFSGDGIYGFDSIAFGDQFSVPSQVIGVINTTDYWLGYFGLGVEPTNFTSTDKPTFLDSMVENQSLIPSHSYGYTAGAHYRLTGIPSSLTLGGYDTHRFDPNGVSFELDVAQTPVVALNEITVIAQPLATSETITEWMNNKTILLESVEAELFTIDSSTPYLWLPEPICLQFEKALGLSYDNKLQLYTFGNESSRHETLVNWNLTFHFLVADSSGSSKSVTLSLPYAAFDLELNYPYPGLNATEASPPTNYFPLRKASNATQYTIGRSFLQETYLIVDYERNNFSISQATFSQDALQDFNLVDITRPKNSTFTGPEVSQTPTLTKSDIAGVAVGVAVAFVLLIIIAYLGFRLKHDHANRGYIKDRSDNNHKSKGRTSNNNLIRCLFCLPKSETPTEIGNSTRLAFEAPNDKEIMELPAGKDTHSELEGSSTDVPAYQEAHGKHGAPVIYAIGHDPEKPVELPYRSSARGFFEPETTPKVQFAAPASHPAVQGNWRLMDRHDSQTTAGISSPSNSPSKRSSKDSSPMFVVSPITPREISPAFSSLDTLTRRGAWYVANDTTSNMPYRQDAPTSHPVTRSEVSEESSASTVTNQIRQSINRGFAPGVRSDHNPAGSDVSNAPTVTNQIRQSVSRGFSWLPAQTSEYEDLANSPPCSTCPSQRNAA